MNMINPNDTLLHADLARCTSYGVNDNTMMTEHLLSNVPAPSKKFCIMSRQVCIMIVSAHFAQWAGPDQNFFKRKDAGESHHSFCKREMTRPTVHGMKNVRYRENWINLQRDLLYLQRLPSFESF